MQASNHPLIKAFTPEMLSVLTDDQLIELDDLIHHDRFHNIDFASEIMLHSLIDYAKRSLLEIDHGKKID